MRIWVDAQLPQALASWMNCTFAVSAIALKDLGLRDAQDFAIFEAARVPGFVIMTKDSDFVDLVCRLGAPPQILWITCGNVTNRALQQLLLLTFPAALEQLHQGATIVEISRL